MKTTAVHKISPTNEVVNNDPMPVLVDKKIIQNPDIRILQRDEKIENSLLSSYNEIDFYLNEVGSKLSKTKTDEEQKQILNSLFKFLNDVRDQYTESVWDEWIKPFIQNHRISNIIHKDPCTKRSYDKPRGYPGDAELLDYFYRKNTFSDLTDEQRTLLNFTTSRPAGSAVRERAEIIGRHIDNALKANNKSRILSIACGHMRELHHSKLFTESSEADFVILDHDATTLNYAHSQFNSKHLKLIKKSFVSIMSRKSLSQLGSFDFVYSAGLFDYLNEKTSAKLTKGMFDLLKPGGRLLITNFVKNIPDRGYMESFMGWNLIFREIQDMDLMQKLIPENNILSKNIFRNSNKNLVFLEIQKSYLD